MPCHYSQLSPFDLSPLSRSQMGGLASLSRGICDFHVCVLFFSENVLSSIVVLRALGRIAFSQGRYEESLQMRRRLHDILMTTSPKSEDLATGKQ